MEFRFRIADLGEASAMPSNPETLEVSVMPTKTKRFRNPRFRSTGSTSPPRCSVCLVCLASLPVVPLTGWMHLPASMSGASVAARSEELRRHRRRFRHHRHAGHPMAAMPSQVRDAINRHLRANAEPNELSQEIAATAKKKSTSERTTPRTPPPSHDSSARSSARPSTARRNP